MDLQFEMIPIGHELDEGNCHESTTCRSAGVSSFFLGKIRVTSKVSPLATRSMFDDDSY